MNDQHHQPVEVVEDGTGHVSPREEPVPPQTTSSTTTSEQDLDLASHEKSATEAKTPELTKTQSQVSEYSKARTGIIVFSLGMALFLAALDISIITTALPTIAERFDASAAGYTWVGSGYILAASASAPVWGKISDIFGRKNIIMLANVIFMASSLIAALSVNVGMLIAARVLQGIGGGGLVILVYVSISDLFSMRDRPKYYGLLGMVWAIASGVGPVVGGVFTEKVSWRWCFYINLPLDGLSLILLAIFLKLSNPRTPILEGLKAIDWLGVFTLVGGVVMFLFGMGSGGVTHSWDSAFVLCLIIFGLLLMVLFFINEWKFAKYPMIPLRLFRDPSNLAAFGVCFIHGWVYIGASKFPCSVII
jgi:MFS family permease